MDWLLRLLTVPFLEKLVDLYKAKLDAGNDSARIAADLAAKELVLQQRELEVEATYKDALLGAWYEPVNLFGYIMVIYFAKVIVWDKVLGFLTHASTDPLQGDIASWAGSIMVFFVGKRGIENVVRILTARK